MFKTVLHKSRMSLKVLHYSWTCQSVRAIAQPIKCPSPQHTFLQAGSDITPVYQEDDLLECLILLRLSSVHPT